MKDHLLIAAFIAMLIILFSIQHHRSATVSPTAPTTPASRSSTPAPAPAGTKGR